MNQPNRNAPTSTIGKSACDDLHPDHPVDSISIKPVCRQHDNEETGKGAEEEKKHENVENDVDDDDNEDSMNEFLANLPLDDMVSLENFVFNGEQATSRTARKDTSSEKSKQELNQENEIFTFAQGSQSIPLFSSSQQRLLLSAACSVAATCIAVLRPSSLNLQQSDNMSNTKLSSSRISASTKTFDNLRRSNNISSKLTLSHLLISVPEHFSTFSLSVSLRREVAHLLSCCIDFEAFDSIFSEIWHVMDCGVNSALLTARDRVVRNIPLILTRSYLQRRQQEQHLHHYEHVENSNRKQQQRTTQEMDLEHKQMEQKAHIILQGCELFANTLAVFVSGMFDAASRNDDLRVLYNALVATCNSFDSKDSLFEDGEQDKGSSYWPPLRQTRDSRYSESAFQSRVSYCSIILDLLLKPTTLNRLPELTLRNIYHRIDIIIDVSRNDIPPSFQGSYTRCCVRMIALLLQKMAPYIYVRDADCLFPTLEHKYLNAAADSIVRKDAASDVDNLVMPAALHGIATLDFINDPYLLRILVTAIFGRYFESLSCLKCCGIQQNDVALGTSTVPGEYTALVNQRIHSFASVMASDSTIVENGINERRKAHMRRFFFGVLISSYMNEEVSLHHAFENLISHIKDLVDRLMWGYLNTIRTTCKLLQTKHSTMPSTVAVSSDGQRTTANEDEDLPAATEKLNASTSKTETPITSTTIDETLLTESLKDLLVYFEQDVLLLLEATCPCIRRLPSGNQAKLLLMHLCGGVIIKRYGQIHAILEASGFTCQSVLRRLKETVRNWHAKFCSDSTALKTAVVITILSSTVWLCECWVS